MSEHYRIWYAIPSADPQRARDCLAQWRARGYRTAVLLDPGVPDVEADFCMHVDTYPGYWRATNLLCRKLPGRRDIVVAGGDDMYPDPNADPQTVAREFFARWPDGFGVMQPIGDDLDGTDRICGSPWLGRGWLQTSYRGRGPFCPQYNAFYGDEELFHVAQLLGVFWQRADLTQYHDHWMRGGRAKTDYQQANDRHWERDQEVFRQRQVQGWPGHERLGSA